MKYEPVFGDQSLFDGAPEEATHATKGGGFYKIENMLAKYVSDGIFNGADVLSVGGYLIAERRIIPEPKRWTVEDQKAGKLPEVGSKAVSVHDFCVVDILAVRNRCVVVCNSDLIDSRPCVFTVDNFIEIFKPIESPEEKAARLREEWCIKALGSCSILSGMKKYELKRLGGYIDDIYDALLSGELTMPSKDGE